MKKCALLVIHGIGTSVENYDEGFKRRLFRSLEKKGKDTEEIAYQKIFWAEYLDRRQMHYFQEARKPPNNLDWVWLRKFVVQALSDASAYQRKHGQSNQNYNNIIRRVHRAVRNLRNELGSDDKPLIIVAHSLGAFIINNFIWDAHKIHQGESVDWPSEITLNGSFEKMVNVTGMITFGCNIPLFVIGNDPIRAIQFPHPELASEHKSRVSWSNYYDPDDVLGWPLRQLPYSLDGLSQPSDHRSYVDVVDRDVVINLGGLLGWSPKSHIDYWTHRKFINPVSNYLEQFLS